MGDLIVIFALSLILTFFIDASKLIELNFWGVRIEEGYIWLSLLMAQIYFCAMAYTEGVFSGLTRGADTTLFKYVFSDPSVRHERVGQLMRTWFASAAAILTTLMILWGMYASFFQNGNSPTIWRI